MAGRASAPVRGGILGDQARWLEQKLAEAARLKAQAEASARRAVQTATQYGRRAVAQGREVASDISKKVGDVAGLAPSPPRRPPPRRPAATRPAANQPKPPNVLRQAGDQAWAAARGAQDAFTFGLGDRAWAGGGALIDAVQGKDLGDAYAQRMATERARDQYDDDHYNAARITGQVLGTGAQIVAAGGVGGIAMRGAAGALRAAGAAPRVIGALEGGARMSQAAKLIPRETVALGGAGAAVGIGGQAVGDAAHGRLSSPADYAGAGMGGAAGTLTARYIGPGYGGSVDGLATSVAQDVLSGRPVSADRARQAAVLGAALGAGGDISGIVASNLAKKPVKEAMGEIASGVRTRVRGDATLDVPKTRYQLPNQKYTYPDQLTAKGGVIESKFGRHARLSKRQKDAYALLGDIYRVDHLLPKDIGAAAGILLAQLGVPPQGRPDEP